MRTPGHALGKQLCPAASPETGAAVYAFLLRQKTPSEKARQFAVLTAGVGARKGSEAGSKTSR